jgi:rSAM/selenodomain-associated transferase 2
MNAGAALSGGKTLVFLHADTLLPGHWQEMAETALRESAIVGGAFDLAIDSERFSLKVIAAAASLRSRITRIPYGDQAIFVRREYFQRIGGFRELPLMEDVDLMRRIRQQGNRITILPAKALTSARRWEEEGALFCTLRNWLLITLYVMGVSPERLARFYR